MNVRRRISKYDDNGVLGLSNDYAYVNASAGTKRIYITWNNVTISANTDYLSLTTDGFITSCNYTNGLIKLNYSANEDTSNSRVSHVYVTYKGLTVTYTLEQEEDDIVDSRYEVVSFNNDEVVIHYTKYNWGNSVTNVSTSSGWSSNRMLEYGGLWKYINVVCGSVDIAYTGLKATLRHVDEYRSGRIVEDPYYIVDASIDVDPVHDAKVSDSIIAVRSSSEDKWYMRGFSWNYVGNLTYGYNGNIITVADNATNKNWPWTSGYAISYPGNIGNFIPFGESITVNQTNTDIPSTLTLTISEPSFGQTYKTYTVT